MSDRNVAIRLGTEGKASVQRDFSDVQTAGVGAMSAIGAAADETASRSEAAANRQLTTWKRQAAAAADAARAGAARGSFDEALSAFGGVNFSRVSGGAREAAEAFGEIEERGGRASVSTMMMEHSLRSAEAAFAAGAPLTMIFTEQLGRLQEAAAMSEMELGTVGEFLTGGWGMALGAAIAVAAPFVENLFEGGDAADEQGGKVETLSAMIDDLAASQARENTTAEQALQNSRNLSAALVVQAARARDTAVATLNLAIAQQQGEKELAQAPGERGDIASLGVVPGASRIAGLQALLEKTQSDFSKGMAEDLNNKFAIAAGNAKVASERSAAATRDYDRTVSHLRGEFQRGAISQQDLTNKLADAQRTLDASGKAAEHHAGAHEHVARASHEAAVAQRDLDSSIAHLTRDFDPAAAAAQDYADRLDDINKALAAKRITPEQADSYRDQAGAERYDAEQRALAQGLTGHLSKSFQEFAASDPLKDLKIDSSVFKKLGDSFQPSLDAQDKIHSLADTFDHAFQGGVGNIWTSFKEQGEQVIAELLAQLVITGKINLQGLSGSGGSGGGIGGLIGSIGGLFGQGKANAATQSSVDSMVAGIMGHNASGTEYWKGGLTDINELGEETVYLPRGSRVVNAADTRRMVNAANDPQRILVSVETNDDVFSARVASISGGQIQQAAPSIAAGGARLSDMSAAKAHRRKLGRF